MAKRPTVYDVAERAGVSIATVSFSFRRPERVKVSTREAVVAAARELGYVPSASARGLADGRTGALGLYSFNYLLAIEPRDAEIRSAVSIGGVNEAGEHPNADLRLFPLYVDEVQRGVELECARRGFALMIGSCSDDAGDEVVADIAGRVDGLAVFPRTLRSDVLQHVSRRIPVVEIAEPSHDDRLNHITVDNVTGMKAITEHLIAEHGLRALEFVGPLDSADNVARFEGFRAALRTARLPAPRRPPYWCRGGEQLAADIVRDLRARRFPDALVCSDDAEALTMIDALAEAGIAVPGEIAVTGFDGTVAGRIARPALTTVRQPMEEIGRAVVDILVQQLGDPDGPPVSRQLPVRVVLRESCGCPPPA